MNDAELLSAWREGDDAAGSTLFGRYFESIRRFFANKTDADAEDLVQSSFERCVRGTEQLRSTAAFRGYLFGIAHNVLLEHYRRRRRDGVVDFTRRSMVDLTGRASAKLARGDDRARLLATLQNLPLELQILLELFYWEHMPASEIAEVLSVPEGTIRSRLHRARDRLRRDFHGADANPSTPAGAEQFDAWARGLRSDE